MKLYIIYRKGMFIPRVVCLPLIDIQTLLVRQCVVLMFTDCGKRQNSTSSGKGKPPPPQTHCLLMTALTLLTVYLGLNSGTFASVVPRV